jgi:hypothetical protein
MRRIGLFLVIFMALTAFVTGSPAMSRADVHVNVGVFAPPPAYVVPAPPPLVVIPGTYVYAIPDIGVDILFYQGYWYRPYEGRWYRARSYNGPWGYLAPAKVPRVMIELPPDYRRLPPGHRRIPYGQFKKSWGRWERERYWDRDKEWQEGRHGGPQGRGGEMREERRHGPEGRGGEERGRGRDGHGGRRD